MISTIAKSHDISFTCEIGKVDDVFADLPSIVSPRLRLLNDFS
jgi:hypothetical protein